ncbi:hypothetical protein FDENT_13601 [Fusarium denticulatum]|uniref:Uncharacterized protein n=1 Tax=Fusarium denticulatum TaxID=48507 RepID=A0A8H5WIB4_9HYPO|nr:hypothetical protein FDENT_13601 [Fusarium denticulatum]
MPNATHPVAKVALPEPYCNSNDKVIKAFYGIHKICGQFPWEFLKSHVPADLGETAAHQLHSAVNKVHMEDCQISFPQLIEQLNKNELKTTHICAAVKWIKNANNSAAPRRSNRASTIRPSEPRNSRHRSVLPSSPSPRRVLQNKQLMESMASFASSKTYRKRQSKTSQATSRDGLPDELEDKSQLNDNLDLEAPKDLGAELNYGMGIDPVIDHGASNDSVRESTNNMAACGIDLDTEIEASRRRLAESRNELQKCKIMLKSEQTACDELQTKIAQGRKAVSTSEEKVQKAAEVETTLGHSYARLRDVAKSYAEDMDMLASMKDPVKKAQERHNKAIRALEEAQNELQTNEQQLRIDKYKHEAAPFWIEQIKKGLCRYEKAIMEEETREKELVTQRYIYTLGIPVDAIRLFVELGSDRCIELMARIGETNNYG